MLEKVLPVNMATGEINPLGTTPELTTLLEYPKTNNYVPAQGRTLENIAAYLYGSEEYWDVLARYNNIPCPLFVPDNVYYVPRTLVSALRVRT